MKQFVAKAAIAVASMAVLAAFAVPAMASAAVWGPPASSKTLNAGVIEVSSPSLGWGLMCTGSTLGVKTRNPSSSVLDVTSATFSGCRGEFSAAMCTTVVATPEKLPWTISALSPQAATLNVGRIRLEYKGSCGSWSGAVVYLTGSVSGLWNATTHSLGFSNASGLQLEGLAPATLEGGVWTDPTGALTLT
jgi:hypothetical protein